MPNFSHILPISLPTDIYIPLFCFSLENKQVGKQTNQNYTEQNKKRAKEKA